MRALAVILTMLAMPAMASFVRGQELSHNLSVCLDKKDMIEVLNEDADKGFEAASVMWGGKERCATVPVTGAKVGRVIHTRDVERDGKKVEGKVVEILHPETGVVVGYFLTSETIAAAVTPQKRGAAS